MTGGYDNGYRACNCFWGRTPGSLILQLKQRIDSFDGLQVLDAGCGEGKNAVYLSSHGASVYAFDISPLALANAKQAWGDVHGIKWEVGDIRTMPLPEGRYDLILAYGLLHCLPDLYTIEHTVARLKNSTRPGGYNIVVAFNHRHQELDAHSEFSPCLVEHSMYARMYDGWQIIQLTDSDLTETHPHNHIKHTHSMTRILAQKRLIP